ncbi:AAA family ATPase [Micromonospora sp. S4605]|uniref:AAA family ATPase n=1 Tax=Micromonospora sp. S4605 TaxID=1420897 RepID=UPI0011B65ABF|nr:AAA family ATPase [Micromonospora sp. S4605]
MTIAIDIPDRTDVGPVIEAERFIIGTALTEIDHTPGADDLAPTEFLQRSHELIWRAILAARAAGEPTDPVAVGERLRAAGDLERVGRMAYLADCTSAAMGPGTVAHHAGIIREAATRRARVQQVARLSQLAGNDEQWERHAPQLLGDLTAVAGAAVATKGFGGTLLRRSQLRTLPPVEPLIDGVMSRRATVLLVGPSNTGKTFVLLSWACAVGTGTPWLGREVHRTPVLYVVGEGANGLDARVSAWEQAWKTKVTDDDVIFAVRPKSLGDPETWVGMREQARRAGSGMVVLDTFSSLGPEVDETKDAATITRRMADLAAAIDGTSVLAHHPGWGDPSRARGGSQLEANVDEVLILSGTSSNPMLELERKKVKDGPAGERTWLRRRAAYGSCVIEGVSASEKNAEMATSAEQIARAVFGEPFTKTMLRDALMERMSVSRTTAYEHITSLERDRVLRYVSGKGRAALFEMV